MLEPLQQWICDVCGEVIETAADGYVIWMQDNQHRNCDFKVIHQKKCDLKDHISSCALPDFLGVEGLTMALSFLSIGPIKMILGQKGGRELKNPDEFVDLLRRFQIPYYEEARRHFSESELLEGFSDANEVYPYQPNVLKKIVLESCRV